ncbi:hypothetical protein ACFQ6S_24615 [Streptomyces sp. NPDC056479]|uniref:hypothetical protein n=1 Tax=Streptomyces sp. NPDC056479 TaxID=3345832 RepID=UPI00367FBD37
MPQETGVKGCAVLQGRTRGRALFASASPSMSRPKIVAGLTDACLRQVKIFYDSVTEVTVPASGLEETGLAKVFENTYRQVNIALVNELSRMAHTLGVDVWHTLELAATKPFGFTKFLPGPGVGALPAHRPCLRQPSRQGTARADLPAHRAGSGHQRKPVRLRGAPLAGVPVKSGTTVARLVSGTVSVRAAAVQSRKYDQNGIVAY